MEPEQKLESLQQVINNFINEFGEESKKNLEHVLENLKHRINEEVINGLTGVMNNYIEQCKNIIKYSHLPLGDLNLSVRAYNKLREANIDTIGKLIRHSPEELLALKNGFGKKSLWDVKQALSRYGISLRDKYK